MGLHYNLALFIGAGVVAGTENVELHTPGHQRDLRIHMQGDLRSRLQGNAIPNFVRGGPADAALPQEAASLICGN